MEIDGHVETTRTVGTSFEKQTDGSWLYKESTGSATWYCAPSGPSSVGTHTVRMLDSKGKVPAEGRYTHTH
jgi:hypothetical protein